MGYLFLSIALAAGATKAYCGKKMGSFAANTQSAVLINIIRMCLCTLFGILLILLGSHCGFLTLDKKALLISAISGISTSVFVVTWLLAVKKSAYMMVDVFLMLGTLVPMVTGYFAFGEDITLKQWIGFAVLIAATLIMCSYNNSIKTRLALSTLIHLIICGMSNGITDFSQKWFVKDFPQIPASVFNFYTYVFAALTLIVFYALTLKKEKPEFEAGSKHKYVYILIMSAALILNSLFKTFAAAHLDSARLYPLNQGAALIISTTMAALFFKEKITLKSVIGIGLAFIGLIIMNVTV